MVMELDSSLGFENFGYEAVVVRANAVRCIIDRAAASRGTPRAVGTQVPEIAGVKPLTAFVGGGPRRVSRHRTGL